MRKLYRILDVNLNRAREGLRVAEDIARFTAGDAELAGALKALRHRLTEIEDGIPGGRARLLAARDVGTDTGAATREEAPGRGTYATAAANLKRAQEACRVLEETAKTFSPATAAAAKALRFAVYDLEQELLARLREIARRERLAEARLYLVAGTRDVPGRDLAAVVREAAAGGATVFQLREKEGATRDIVRLAAELREVTRQCGMLFIVNDRVDIAAAVDADGVHLGQDDLPVRAARRVLGWDRIIGVSTHSLVQACRAEEEGADYIGVGPVHPTRTKPDYPVVGLELVRQVAARVRIPFFAIGGIKETNVRDVLAAGARRVAVVSALTAAPDIAAAARALCASIQEFEVTPE
ncbi:MAG: thiamine phosphate synthase [Desulfotomaculales bacterium]